MKEMTHCSRQDLQAMSCSRQKPAETAGHSAGNLSLPYSQVLRQMRNQELMAATGRTRFGY